MSTLNYVKLAIPSKLLFAWQHTVFSTPFLVNMSNSLASSMQEAFFDQLQIAMLRA